MSGARIDFLHRRHTPAIGWCLLLAGLTSLGAMASQQQAWDAERQRRQESRAAQQSAQRRAAEAARRPHVPTAEERRVSRIASQLQQPWLPTLRAVENATENPVFLLAMSIDPASGRVQLEAEAPSFDHAMAYVQRLSDDGPLVDAQMASHEGVVDAGRSFVRFTVVTRWKGRS